jgi:hypothetical protein
MDWPGAAIRQPKNPSGMEGTDAQVLASFAALRELSVSRKGAKPAKQQWELFAAVPHSAHRRFYAANNLVRKISF